MRVPEPPAAFRVIVFAAACAVVLWLSLAPADSLPDTGVWDKIQHAGVYAGLALLGAWSFRARLLRLTVGLMALGIGIEALQTAMGFGRQGSALDAMANALGIAAGIALILARRRLTP